jgi:hypothetical protein
MFPVIQRMSISLTLLRPLFVLYFTVIFESLRHYATNRNMEGSIPDEVTGFFNLPNRSRDSAVCIATGYGLNDRRVGVQFLVGVKNFCSPLRPDRLWGPPNLLSNEYRG